MLLGQDMDQIILLQTESEIIVDGTIDVELNRKAV